MALQERLQQIADGLEGTLGLAVRVPRTGDEFRIRDQELFPLASVFKVPLLVELMRQVEAGPLSLDDPVSLRAEDLSPGSGVLKEFRPGASLTLWDLAVLMIIVSDNSATDMLYERIGGGAAIAACMHSLGLRNIAVPFDCKALLTAAVGLDPADRSAANLDEVRRRLKANVVDPASGALQCSLDNNCATPADLLALLSGIEERRVVSPTACETILDILLRQQLNQRVPLLLPPGTRVAHKTGTVHDTRNDCGIIYLPGGDPIIFCALTRGIDPANWRQGDLAIAEAALAVYQAYAG